MARPPKKEPRLIQVPLRATEEERQQLYTIASNRGLHFSDMIRKDYLQKEPRVTFATPERKKLIEAIALLGQTVTFLNAVNPKDATQAAQIKSAIDGALLFFNFIQSEINGHQG